MHRQGLRGGRFKTQFQDKSGKGRGRSPNRNDDNPFSPGQSSLFASHGTTMNRTPSPQGERNKERGIPQEEIDKRNARAERFGIQLDPSQRRSMGNRMFEHKKTIEIREPPPDPIDDFLKVVDEYAKTQTLIKKVKETRQTNINRLVAWDFFHDELYPITLESLYQNDKRGQRMDPVDEEEEYIEEGSIQRDRLKGDEVPPTPRFLDVEMEDVHQFLTSPLPSSPAFRMFESMDVDETFPSSPSFTPQVQHSFETVYTPPLINQLQSDKNRKPSIFLRLGRKESITSAPPGPADNKIFDDKGIINHAVIQKDLRTFSSMDVEYGSLLENDEDGFSEPDKSIVAKQDPKVSGINLKEMEESEQDEKEVEEPQNSDDEDNLPSPTVLNPKLDLYNWVFGPPPLTRAQSGYQEKIQTRKDKYKKPRFPDRKRNEKERKKREYHTRISENRNIKEVLDDIDRKKALCTRELNSEEKTYNKNTVLNYKTNKLQDDYVIVREELIRRSRIVDRHNKESLDRAKKDSKYKHSFSKVMRDAEKEIYNTPSLITSS